MRGSFLVPFASVNFSEFSIALSSFSLPNLNLLDLLTLECWYNDPPSFGVTYFNDIQ